jgi:hypothetical protein
MLTALKRWWLNHHLTWLIGRLVVARQEREAAIQMMDQELRAIEQKKCDIILALIDLEASSRA